MYLCTVKLLYDTMEVFIKETAKKHGVSLTLLSDRLGVSRQTIYFYIEQGAKNPFCKLEEIADAIGCEVWELFDGDDRMLKEGDIPYNLIKCPHCGKSIKLNAEALE